MPTPLATVLIGFGAVLTSINAESGCAVAGIGVLLQCINFVLDGLEQPSSDG